MGTMKDDFGYLLSDTTRYARTMMTEGLRNHGLDHDGYVVLFHTERAGEAGLSIRALSDILRVTTSQLDGWVERLARDGWVTQHPDPDDPGSRLLRLTPKAVKAVPLLTDAARWTIERGLNGFSDEEIGLFTEYLERMRANLR